MGKFTRIALEGATIDGRKISRKQIEQMAAQYDPDKRHGARIWLEHFRSLFADGVFPALGDVLALKTQEVEVDGKTKLGLYAQLKPTEKLIKMNQDRQKVYTSIEMNSDYADTGKAYLTGLAVTDTPASQGTEMLAFSQKNNFKELENKLFSEYIETTLELTAGDDPEEESLFSRITGYFKKHENHNDERFSDHEKSMELIAQELDKTQSQYSDLQKEHKQLSDDFSEKVGELQTELKELKEFKADVEKHSTNKPVPKAKGGNESGKRKKGFF